MLSTTPRITEKIDNQGTFSAFTPEDGKPIPTKLDTVLFVDDDDVLRGVMEACLGMMGYVVIPCSDARAASEAFKSTSIDMLLTDLQMPGRSGVELARELTLLNPALPVMIISGSIPSDELLSEVQRRNWKFLGKPCRLPTLAAHIQSLLRSRYEYAA